MHRAMALPAGTPCRLADVRLAQDRTGKPGALWAYDDFHATFHFLDHMPWRLNPYGLKIFLPQLSSSEWQDQNDNLKLEGEQFRMAKREAEKKKFMETARFMAEVQGAQKEKFALSNSRAKRKAETMKSERDQKITKAFQRMWVQVGDLYGPCPEQLGLAKIVSEAEDSCKA
mgnify:CR=1 FL=1